MQRSSRLQDKWQNAVFFLIGLVIVVADQLSKAWIKTNLASGESLLDTGFFRITHVHNTGAAFGIFQDHSLMLTIIGIIGVIAILICSRFSSSSVPVLRSWLGRIALGLVLGGTVGNLIDRLHQGYVTDFIDFRFWPAFNVADAAVTVGVIILACSLLRLALSSKS